MSFIKLLAKTAVITLAVIFTIGILIALAIPSEEEVQQSVNNLHLQTARDFEQQYQAVQRNGTRMDRCVRAGFVAEAYLQANDDTNFTKWQEIKAADCRAAGLPI
jgi:competence protein ComGC